MTSLREQLIEEAEAYQRDGCALPLDLISSLMAEGIDHTLFSPDYLPTNQDDDKEIHNVD